MQVRTNLHYRAFVSKAGLQRQKSFTEKCFWSLGTSPLGFRGLGCVDQTSAAGSITGVLGFGSGIKWYYY